MKSKLRSDMENKLVFYYKILNNKYELDIGENF